VSWQSALVAAPVDPASRQRGVRGRVARILTVCAAVALLLTQLHGTASGSGGTNGRSYQYTFHTGELGSTRWLLVAAGLFLCGGGALWMARTKGFVALSALLGVVGLGVLVWAFLAPGARRLSQEMYGSVPLGASKSVVTERFGGPTSTNASAVLGGRGRTLACFVYQPRPASAPGTFAYLFCFDDGRLRFKSGV
jgi:hypothetical protein